MKRPQGLKKDTFREITNTISKYISIILIVGLGVFVFVGLITTGPLMRDTLEKSIKKSNMEDIRITSALGLKEKDLRILENLEGIDKLSLDYDEDLFVVGKDFAIKVLSMPKSISLPNIIEGRDIENEGEIILDKTLKKEGYKLNDSINFKKEVNKFASKDEKRDDHLKNYTYKIVGFADYIENVKNITRGNSQRGLGELKGFAFVERSNFLSDPTIARIILKDTENLKTSSKKYQDLLKKYEDELEIDFKYRPKERLEELKLDIEDKIVEGEDQIDSANAKLLDGKNELEEDREKLSDAREKYKDGKNKFDEESQKGREKLSEAKEKLADAKKKIDENQSKINDGQNQLANGDLDLRGAKVELERGKAQYNNGKEELEKGKGKLEATKISLDQANNQLIEGRKKLDQGWEKIKKSQEELKEAEEKLNQGKKQYEDGKAQYEKGLEELQNSVPGGKGKSPETIKSELQVIKDILVNNPEIEKILPELGQLNKNIEDLNNKKNELEGKLNELLSLPEEEQKKHQGEIYQLKIQIAAIETQLKTLEEIENKIKDLEDKYGLGDLDLSKINLENINSGIEGADKLIEAKKELDKAQIQLAEGQAKYDMGKDALDMGIKQAQEGELEYKENYEKYLDGLRQYEEGLKKLGDSEKELNEAKEKLDKGEIDYDRAKLKYDENYKKFIEGKSQLKSGREEYERGLEDYKSGLKDFEEGETKGKKQLKDALYEINKGQRKLDKGQREYDEKSLEADEKIKDGLDKINDAKRILKILSQPSYEITPRHLNEDINTYIDYAHRVDLLSLVFPVFFFLISMLVCWTTMTRMVEENRINIGTYKALGYSNRQIASKYFIYGESSALIGGIIGALIGAFALSRLIGNSYSVDTIFEKNLIFKFYPIRTLFAIIVGLLATGITAMISVYASLRNNAANLLRGPAPKGGTRILIERIKPLWKRLSFLQKVTARNLFRYKKRMIMTVIGIMGCSALLVLGFGIEGSVKGIKDKQFKQVMKYNLAVFYDREIDKKSFDKFKEEIKKDQRIEKYASFNMSNFKSKFNKIDQDVSVVVPENLEEFSKFYTLRTRRNKKEIKLTDRGAVITEKLSKLKKVKVGDSLEIKDKDGETYKVQISGIAEMYVGHNLFMTPKYYEKVFGKNFVSNCEALKLKNPEDISKISKDFMDYKCATSTMDVSVLEKTLDNFMSSIYLVVATIVLASSMLAVIVLYNLTNINIEERKRELSTIKVLGFYPKEVTSYIYRETWILTIIGIGIGLLVGKILHYGVLQVVAPYMAMLDPVLVKRAYLFSALITTIVTFFVMLIFHKKLKKIDMVQALKAQE